MKAAGVLPGQQGELSRGRRRPLGAYFVSSEQELLAVAGRGRGGRSCPVLASRPRKGQACSSRSGPAAAGHLTRYGPDPGVRASVWHASLSGGGPCGL